MDVNNSNNGGGDGERGSRRRNSYDCSGPTTTVISTSLCAADRRRNSDIGPISFSTERELYRECRRLNRYKNSSSWCSVNTSLHSNHTRNKQQKLFLIR